MYVKQDTLECINLKDLKKRIEVLQTDIQYLRGKCLCLSEQLGAILDSSYEIEDLIDTELLRREV